MRKILSFIFMILISFNFTNMASAKSISNVHIKSLPTEQINLDTIKIDEVPTLELLKMINNEDKKVADSVAGHLDEIAKAIDAISEKFAEGGRIVYMGAGTAGRLGNVDASECPSTFGLPRERVVAVVAGGIDALFEDILGVEDDSEQGMKDLQNIDFNENDVLIGVSASGRTPYVVGGIEYAKKVGSVTVSLTCNEDLNSPINSLVDFPIAINAGPEVIAGSVRMKGGTIQKMVLNMISTGVMIKNGKVYNNLMINVQMRNDKLRMRARNIISEITGAEQSEIENMLAETKDNVPLSIFMLLTSCQKEKANQIMAQVNGNLKKALKLYNELARTSALVC